MPEISLPTASKQDSILSKQDTTINVLGSPNPTVGNETSIMNYLKKINNTQLPSGGLKPITYYGYSFDYGSWKTIFSVNGSGFLKKAAVIPTATYTNSYTLSIKITIDDVVIFNVSTTPNNSFGSAIGIYSDMFLFMPSESANRAYGVVGSARAPIYTLASYVTGTAITGIDTCVNLGGDKIPFNKNLKVEVNCNAGSTRVCEVIAEVY